MGLGRSRLKVDKPESSSFLKLKSGLQQLSPALPYGPIPWPQITL